MDASEAILFSNRNRDDNFGGGMFMWVIVLLLIFFAFGWGGNFGNRGGNYGGHDNNSADIGALSAIITAQNANVRSSDLSQVERDVLTTSATSQQDVFNTACKTQESIFNTACATQKQILESQYATQLGFQNTQAQLAQCCCDVKTAILNDGEQTRALIQGNTIQALRDSNNELQRQLTVYQLTAQNQAQTTSLVDTLLPRAVPAYPSCSPYMATYYGTSTLNGVYGNCGCNA